jgi:hypothetical protein
MRTADQRYPQQHQREQVQQGVVQRQAAVHQRQQQLAMPPQRPIGPETEPEQHEQQADTNQDGSSGQALSED